MYWESPTPPWQRSSDRHRYYAIVAAPRAADPPAQYSGSGRSSLVATVGQTLECGAVGDGYDRPAP